MRISERGRLSRAYSEEELAGELRRRLRVKNEEKAGDQAGDASKKDDDAGDEIDPLTDDAGGGS